MAGLTGVVVGAVILLISMIVTRLWQHDDPNLQKPPTIGETVPFVSNAWQFMTHKRRFIARVSRVLQDSPIAQCQLGFMNIYIITGGSNVSSLFRASFNSEPWLLKIFEKAAGYEPADMVNYYVDQTGGAILPRRGSTELPPEKRIWNGIHRMHDETLLGPRNLAAFAKSFQAFFGRELATIPAGKWVEDIYILNFLQTRMGDASTRTFLGPNIIDMNPDFMKAFWQYERQAEKLAFGLPTWMNGRAIRMRDKLNDMCRKWFEFSDAKYDWESPNQDVDWEPLFGLAHSRGLVRWAKSFNFSNQSIGAAFSLFMFGLHANTIPTCAWIMFELLKDPELYQAVKAEVKQAELTDESGDVYFDHQKLTTQPLLQSVFNEVLRLHAVLLLTRTSTESVTVAGYTLPSGSTVQAPTRVAHLRESVWGTPEHPATEFWAYRHVKEVEVTDEQGRTTKKLEFSMAGRDRWFFPWGGGVSICAGRYIATTEVMLAISMLIARFEIERVSWVKHDGSASKKAAEDDLSNANAVVAQPDRDMKVRWRRMW
ncbi:putative cytochrome P450 [Xylaria sp. FL0064]|nr:putative cytochrome P450 [Xylaria sp. FL0064]